MESESFTLTTFNYLLIPELPKKLFYFLFFKIDLFFSFIKKVVEVVKVVIWYYIIIMYVIKKTNMVLFYNGFRFFTY